MQYKTPSKHRSLFTSTLCFSLAAALFLFALPITAHAAPGDLDATFSGDGKLTDGLSRGDDFARGTAVQPDGKIVVAGSSWTGLSLDFAVARYNTDGSLDTTFGSGGKVTTDFSTSSLLPSYDQANSVAIQPDGKIVAAGLSSNSGGYFALVRYNSDGSLDTSFDGDGKVTTQIGGGSIYAYSVAIQPDGKIVAAGHSGVIVRYNANGSLDTTFDGDGVVTIGSGGSAYSVAIQADGKIVVAGSSWTGSNFGFAIVRYNANGSLDTTLDGDGKVITQVGSGHSQAYSVAIQTDGKIVAVGQAVEGFALARYNPNGSLEIGVTTPMSSNFYSAGAKSVAIQSDGKIVAAGNGYRGSDDDFAVVRYNANCSLDTTFDGDGIATAPVGSGYGANSVAIQPDGKIVAAGVSLNGSNEDFVVVRHNADGSLDTAFDTDGTLTTDFGFFQDNALFDTAIQPDGKIVAAGNVRGDFAVVRYNSDGSPDTTFGKTGKVSTDMGTPGDSAYAVAIQPDGKIVAAGASLDDEWFVPGHFALARYNVDGSLDTTFGGNGAVISLGGNSAALDVAIQPDGKIVAVGFSNFSSVLFAVVRYNTDGSLDASFDGDGIVTTPIGDYAVATSVAIQPGGKLVVAGYSNVGGSNNDFAVVRYNTNGSLDTSFDGDGIVTTSIVSDDFAQDVAVQSDGKIVVAGCSSALYDFACHAFAFVRYNANGSIDTTFDSDGKVTTQIFGFGFTYLNSVAIRPDGKIVGAGYSYNGSNYDFALALHNVDGSLDTTFGGGDGITTVDFNTSSDAAYGIALDGQGRTVLVGESDGRFAIARFLLGTLDAEVSISGRVTTANGRGLGNTIISATDSLGVRRTAMTSTFGYYSFNSIPGDTYTFAIRSKRYAFEPRTVFVNENLSGFDFVALK